MKWGRAWVVSLGLSGAVFALLLLHQRGLQGMPWLPGCIFHRLMGLHCPGCGMTRATAAALQGNFGAAFRFNPVGVILLPLALVGAGLEMIGWIRDKPLPFRLKIGARGAWAIVWIMVSFWILRNIPLWPFTWLAPS